MNRTSLRKLIAFALLLPACVANAEIKPGALFCEGAVLQRDASIPVWGTADPGEQIQVRFRGQSVSAKSDEQGNWRAALQPEKAGGPDALVLEGKSGAVTVNNILPAHAPSPSAANCKGREVRIAFTCEPGASLVCSPEARPQGVEMAGPDGKFYPAQTRVDKNGVVAFSEQVSEPAAIRYTGGTMAQLGVSDSNRLPAGPFAFERKNNGWKPSAEPPAPHKP